MGESKRSVKNKARVEELVQLTCIVKQHIFVLIISRTSFCRLKMLGMKHTGKIKHVTQHYQCFEKLVVTQGRSRLIG